MYSLQLFRISEIALVIVGVTAWYFDCPDIKPKCRCSPNGEDHLNEAQCRATDYDELHSILKKASGHSFARFEIAKSKLATLNETLFPFMKVKTLAILFSTIETFHLFEGLSSLRELTKLVIENVDVKKWEWTPANESYEMHINLIKSVKLLDCPVGSDKYYKILEYFPNTLTSIVVFWCTLKLEDNASFQKLTNIEVIDLRHNQLTTIKRNHFPRPANNLSFLCVSNNPISSLPDDMFVNMPKLHTVIMEGTSLTTLPHETFEPILNQLSSLEVANNPLNCDCNNVWLTTKASIWKGEALKCEIPEYLRNKEIGLLNPTQMCLSKDKALSYRKLQINYCPYLLTNPVPYQNFKNLDV